METYSAKYWNKLYRNVLMSSKYGAAGGRIETNPKLSGRIRNQSTKIHDITITVDDLKDLWERQGGKCHWLGCSMSMDDLFVSHSPFAPSVDRLDNKKEYHKDNIVLCVRFANKGRGAYNNPDFKQRLTSLLKIS